MDLSRRSLLGGALGVGATGLLAPTADALPHRAPGAGAPVRTDPFTLGLASGDPDPTSVVLWTRLAVDPVDPSGTGGMPGRRVPVQWQVATDERMRRVVRRGTALARPEEAHAVHVEARGLRPGCEYFYRFRSGRWVSPVARTRTAPAPWEMPAALAMAFASCSHWEAGWFTTYRHLAAEQPDLVLHLGDYQYEGKPKGSGAVRQHAGPETSDLASYRIRHGQYKTDPDLQAAHAAAPWLVVFDDHEVDNNWAGDIPQDRKPAEGNDTLEHFRARKAAAFKAYWEHMPLRRSSLPRGAGIQVYRRLHWGRLATMHMMDTRQYRDDQACGDGWKTGCDARLDPSRTLTGAAQERWLLDGFRASRAQWDLLGQQVFFAERDGNPAPGVEHVSMDGWDGYAASRRRITQGWIDAGVRNPVVLTGDVHRHWASDIRLDHQDTDSPIVGSELVTTSVTSGGDGNGSTTDPAMPHNPHLRYFEDRRGYVSTRITRRALQADYRSIAQVSVPGSPVRTSASFRLDDGRRGLVRRTV